MILARIRRLSLIRIVAVVEFYHSYVKWAWSKTLF